MTYRLENALYQWEEGHLRLHELSAGPGAAGIDRAVEAIREELRRRIGPTYSAAELAALYAKGTDWCLAAAARAVPGQSVDLDPQALADGAFYLHLRGASDWSGGGVISE